MLSKNAFRAALAVVAAAFTLSLASHAEVSVGSKSARPLITQKIDESKLVTLEGNTRPEAQTASNDRGPAADSLRIPDIQLQLKRSPEQEKALEKLIDQMHTPGSVYFHQWLHEAEFDETFGVNHNDIQKLTDWLQSHGFTIIGVQPDGMVIDFTGDAAQVREAFHTQIEKLELKNGEQHYANASDPKVPVAFANVVVGPMQMHDFRAHPMHTPAKTSRTGVKPHLKQGPNGEFTFAGCDFTTSLHPGGAGDENCYALVPGDVQTIYNLTPFYAAGYTGKGMTIGLIEEGDDFADADWTNFIKQFGLTSYGGSLSTIHPTGASSCPDPGQDGVDDEVEIDVEYSSAAAPGAAVEIVACRSLTSAINNLVAGATPPPIISMSYGNCEAKNGAATNAAYFTAFQKAAAKGISVFVSSGDESSTSCDANAVSATHGTGISGFASTPYNVAVGGTDFEDVVLNTASTYWHAGTAGDPNGTFYNSAKSYIPEIPWNDSCASELISTYLGFATTYGTSGFCNSTTATTSNDFLSTGSGSGGPSGCYTGVASTRSVVSGTCAGQPKPSWQGSTTVGTASTVVGNPADGVRDIPDVSLMAANGIWNHFYTVCWSDTAEGGSACTAGPFVAGSSTDPSTWPGFGGTSVSSPIMAGIQALVNQYVGSTTNGAGALQGVPNYVYYKLAAAEYGASGNAACNSNKSGGPAGTCIFYDVTHGDMNVNCLALSGTLHNCYLPSGTNGVGSVTNAAYNKTYGTNTGWDFPTGIGSVNAWNLATNWRTAFPTNTALVTGSNTNTGDASDMLTATVAAATLDNTLGGAGDTTVPIAGSVTFNSGTTTLGSCTLSSATCSISVTGSQLVNGANSITATYAGNNAYPPSTSAASTITETSDIVFTTVNHNFGQVQVGTTAAAYGVQVKNQDATAFPFTLTLTGSSAFTQTNSCGTSIAAGKTCDIQFSFKPTAAGIVSGSWHLAGTSTAFSPANGGTLTGSGISQGGVSLTTAGHNFGTVMVGMTSTTYGTTLSNSTTSAETLSLATPSAPFHMITNCTATLAAGSSCELEFTYTPTTTSPVSTVVTLSGSPTAITVGGAALPNGGITLSGN